MSKAFAAEKAIRLFSVSMTLVTLFPYFLEATTSGAYFSWLRFRLFHVFP
jgi:hypothetical protein